MSVALSCAHMIRVRGVKLGGDADEMLPEGAVQLDDDTLNFDDAGFSRTELPEGGGVEETREGEEKEEEDEEEDEVCACIICMCFCECNLFLFLFGLATLDRSRSD